MKQKKPDISDARLLVLFKESVASFSHCRNHYITFRVFFNKGFLQDLRQNRTIGLRCCLQDIPQRTPPSCLVPLRAHPIRLQGGKIRQPEADSLKRASSSVWRSAMELVVDLLAYSHLYYIAYRLFSPCKRIAI